MFEKLIVSLLNLARVMARVCYKQIWSYMFLPFNLRI